MEYRDRIIAVFPETDANELGRGAAVRFVCVCVCAIWPRFSARAA
ncbi:hypothetical protein L835_3479 [Mycobacteroides abscessus MAB_110811_1470]|nr:hypothetical protein L835_3479 [Mycobacteroides abscessus MAB_110811_1470]